jgi:hypothetical protein
VQPQAYSKRPAPPSHTNTHNSSSSTSLLAAASSLLHKVPGARRISLFNATLLALLGLGAALAAWGGGCAALLVLLARCVKGQTHTSKKRGLLYRYAVLVGLAVQRR